MYENQVQIEQKHVHEHLTRKNCTYTLLTLVADGAFYGEALVV